MLARIERLGALVGLIVVGLGVCTYLPLPSPVLAFRLPGVPSIITLTLTPARQVSLLVALLACALVDSIVRREEALLGSSLARTFPFWVLPGLVILWVFPQYDVLTGTMPRLLMIVGTAATVAVIVLAQVRTLGPQDHLFGLARLALNAAAYGIALSAFYQAYTLPTRALVAVPLVALVSLLLALQILESTPISTMRLWGSAALVGFLMAEIAWALSFGALLPLPASFLLLLVFYLLTGLMQQLYWGRLRRQIVIEFLAVAAIALSLLLAFAR